MPSTIHTFASPFLTSCWLVVAVLLTVGCRPEPPEIVYGMLDLRDVALDRPIPLEGTWLARGGVDSMAFAAFDYDDSRWRPAVVENLFTDQGFPDEGLVWYRTTLRLPPDAPSLKGYLEHGNNAHEIYVARPGEPPALVAASGRPALTADATIRSRRPVTFRLPADSVLVLSWKVANHKYQHGGPFYAIQIGSAHAIDQMLLKQRALAFSSFGLYLLLGLAFVFFFRYGNHRNWPMRAVGLLALVMATRTLTTAGYLELLLPELVDFDLRIAVEATTYLVLPGLFAFLLWAFFPLEFLEMRVTDWRIHILQPDEEQSLRTYRLVDEPPPIARWLRWCTTVPALFAVITSLFFSLTVWIVPPSVTSSLLDVARWISLILVPPAVIVLGAAIQRRRPLARSTAFGFGLVIAGGVHDILLAMGIILGSFYVVTYAFTGFILIEGIAVARLFVQDLHAATIAAQAANRTKSHFLNTVSHEIRTPLTAIMGFNQILEAELAHRIEPHEREFLEIIRTSSQRLLDLVNNLLDVAKAETGQLELHLSPVLLSAVIDDVTNQLHLAAKRKGLDLRVESAFGDLVARADEPRLRQVLLNLVSNAVKFTDAGHITVRIGKALLALHQPDALQPAVTVSVEDTGVGISPEFMPRLFDRFTQEERTYDERFQGTGLGLSIARELVHSMHGEIYVQSQVNAGSTFTVVLPSIEGATFATPKSQREPEKSEKGEVGERGSR